MAKKKLTKDQKRKERLRKAIQWVYTYQGSHAVRDYCKRFKVDPICAAKDLAAIGASSEEQRNQLKQQEQLRLQQRRKEREAKRLKELEERLENPDTPVSGIENKPQTKKASHAGSQPAKKPKRRCPDCGRAMKQQFIGLNHCKCGMSWSKADGYFERSPDMVFALQRKVTKKGKNSIRTKQVPVIRHKGPETTV